jgi:DNA-damage-inducible protein D
MNQDKMNLEPAKSTSNIFESLRRKNDKGGDFWSSRDMANVLGYSEYRNFEGVIKKAELACFNSAQDVKEHFVQYNEMLEVGNGGQREAKSVQLSRYACYLIIQNADPSKNVVAEGQTYFAVQTRRQELTDQGREHEDKLRVTLREEIRAHNKRLTGVAKNAGVESPLDFAIFQNHGYQGLYGGLTSDDIHRKKGLKKGQQILDHMGSTELAANFFRVTQAEEKLQRENIKGKENANRAHREVGAKVRKTIEEIGGTLPENFSTMDDVKKIGRRQKPAPGKSKETE